MHQKEFPKSENFAEQNIILEQESKESGRWNTLEYPKEVLNVLVPEKLKEPNLEVLSLASKRAGDFFIVSKTEDVVAHDDEEQFLEYDRYQNFIFRSQLTGESLGSQKLIALWSLSLASRKVVSIDWFELRKELRGQKLSKSFYENLYQLLKSHQFKAVVAKPGITLDPKLMDYHLKTLEMKHLSELPEKELHTLFGYLPEISEVASSVFRSI